MSSTASIFQLSILRGVCKDVPVQNDGLPCHITCRTYLTYQVHYADTDFGGQKGLTIIEWLELAPKRGMLSQYLT